MKIATLSIQKFIAAVIIAIALSFAFAPYSAPVSNPVIEVTPVPTPAPVYITVEPTPHIEPQQTMMTAEEAITEMVGITEEIILSPVILFFILIPIGLLVLRFVIQIDRYQF